MPLTLCEPCGCIPGNEQLQTWQQNVRSTLCSILTAVQSGPIGTDLVSIPAVNLAFGSIGSTYGTTGFAVSGDLHELGVLNNTNQDMQISYNGGVTDGPIIPTGAFRQFNFVTNGGVMPATTIFIKYLNGAAPTAGSVFIDGFK